MAWVVALPVFAGLLALWFTGRLVGRIVAFVCLAVVFIFLGVALPALHQESVIALPLEIIAAWFASGIPTYIARRRQS